jgi:hypothetical protein
MFYHLGKNVIFELCRVRCSAFSRLRKVRKKQEKVVTNDPNIVRTYE